MNGERETSDLTEQWICVEIHHWITLTIQIALGKWDGESQNQYETNEW